MFKKYLVKTLRIKCYCRDGRYYPDTGGFNCNCDLSEPCKNCQGTRFITINSKDPRFKEEYEKFIMKELDRLIKEYAQAIASTGNLGAEVVKYRKEYGKLTRGK